MHNQTTQLDLEFQPQFPLLGKRFGRWTVIGVGIPYQTPLGKTKESTSVCSCDCGNIKTVRNSHLKSGRSRSCNCLNRELFRERILVHGHTINHKASKTWVAWAGMHARCSDPNRESFKHYGGRG